MTLKKLLTNHWDDDPEWFENSFPLGYSLGFDAMCDFVSRVESDYDVYFHYDDFYPAPPEERLETAHFTRPSEMSVHIYERVAFVRLMNGDVEIDLFFNPSWIKYLFYEIYEYDNPMEHFNDLFSNGGEEGLKILLSARVSMQTKKVYIYLPISREILEIPAKDYYSKTFRIDCHIKHFFTSKIGKDVFEEVLSFISPCCKHLQSNLSNGKMNITVLKGMLHYDGTSAPFPKGIPLYTLSSVFDELAKKSDLRYCDVKEVYYRKHLGKYTIDDTTIPRSKVMFLKNVFKTLDPDYYFPGYKKSILSKEDIDELIVYRDNHQSLYYKEMVKDGFDSASILKKVEDRISYEKKARFSNTTFTIDELKQGYADKRDFDLQRVPADLLPEVLTDVVEPSWPIKDAKIDDLVGFHAVLNCQNEKIYPHSPVEYKSIKTKLNRICRRSKLSNYSTSKSLYQNKLKNLTERKKLTIHDIRHIEKLLSNKSLDKQLKEKLKSLIPDRDTREIDPGIKKQRIRTFQTWISNFFYHRNRERWQGKNFYELCSIDNYIKANKIKEITPHEYMEFVEKYGDFVESYRYFATEGDKDLTESDCNLFNSNSDY